MNKEKLEILNMIKDQTITPEEGLNLLNAIQEENVKFIYDDTKSKTENIIKIFATSNSNSDVTQQDINNLMELVIDEEQSEKNTKIKAGKNGNIEIKTNDKNFSILKSEFDKKSHDGKSKNKSKIEIVVQKPDGKTQTFQF